MDAPAFTTRRLVYFAFLAAIWAPIVAVLCSPQLRTFAARVSHDPSSFETERNRLRMATPLWNRAVAFYNDSLYALGVSGRPGAALVGRGGWVFLGDLFDNNIAQALGRRVLDDREVAEWTGTFEAETHWLARRNIASAIVIAPAKWSIYPDRLPWWTQGTARVHSLDRVLAAGKSLPLIDVRDALREARNHADTYSALNSHWTDYGAWVAWTRIAAELPRYVPLPAPNLRALKSVYVSDEQNEFAGMLNLDATNEWTKYELATPLSDALVVHADGSTAPLPGGARTDLLDLPRTTRNDHAPNRSRVLVLRDSSANSLSPFLQDSYFMTHQVDHRLGQPGTWPNLAGLVEEFRPDIVLWVVTERYLNGPAGNADYWRAATAFDCADEKPLDAWSGDAARMQRSDDGSEDRLALRDGIDRSAVIRIGVEGDADGELSVKNGDAATIEPARINFSKGRNELFFKVARVQRDEPLVISRSAAHARVSSVEIRTGGCLAPSAGADAVVATRTPAVAAAPARDR